MHHRLPLFLIALLFAAVGPAVGQTIEVTGGATVQVQNGAVLDLEGGQMDLGPAGATTRLEETGAGRVAGGTLTATRSLGSPSSADPAGLGVVLTAGVDLGEVTVTRGHAVQTGGGNQGIARYYEISPSQNNDGLDATLTHTYHDEELNGLPESELVLFKSTDGGATWDRKGADGRTTSPTGGNTVTLSGITSFSRWSLASESSPLPVEMASFDGRTAEEGVRLQWQTASETNNAGFRILRKGEGAKGGWTEVGFVEGAGTTTEPQRYRFTDADLPYAADTLSYRLKQVDTDGSASVTDPVTVARSGPNGLELRGTAPNPARQRATVRFAIPEGSDAVGVTMRLYDVMGRQVRTVTASAEPGRHERAIDVSSLASGVYVLRLRAGGTAKTRKLTVVR